MSLSARRAWIEIFPLDNVAHGGPSLSARRAWIEITSEVSERVPLAVALRKESVDRNIKAVVSYNIKETSLSARRAWIEILVFAR